MQAKIEEVLFKSINELGKKMKEELHFSNFEEAYQNNNPIKFAKSYFEEVKEIKKIPQNLIEGMNKIKNFNELIKTLSKQEPKFKVLVFNFSKKEFIKSSSILFYTNFLNSFFIDRSREEFYERCSTILLSKDPMIDLLTNWKTYLSLACFIFTKKTRSDREISLDQNAFFYEAKIPKLVDPDFLTECKNNKKLPDGIFYQLQFMFNLIDQSSDHKIIECFLSAIKKMMDIIKMEKITKESYKIFAEKMRIKNLSYILQKRNKRLQTDGSNDSNSKEENENPSSNNTLLQTTFVHLKEDNENQNLTTSTEYASLEEKKYNFWNETDEKYSFENGIFYDDSKFQERKKESIEKWENGIIEKLTLYESTKDFQQKKNQQQSEGKLYKLFCYNEKERKWKKGVNDYSTFFKDKNKFNSNDYVTPLIFFYNSKEDDLIAINSNFINKYPSIEKEEEIFIYGLCDESMYDICKDYLGSQENFKNIIPIFLHLHVPKSKENLPNLKTIVLQISTFISFISNINIIVLDKEHYEDQIEMLNEINSIKLSYKEENENLSNPQHFEIPEKIDFVNDIKDDIFNKSMKPLYSTENINDINFDILSKLDGKVYNKSKHIILFNEPTFKYTDIAESLVARNDLIVSENAKIIQNCEIDYSCNFIDVNDSTTYKGFIKIFSGYVSNIETKLSEISQNFGCIQLADMTPLYLQIKSQVNNDEYKKIKNLQETQKSINLINEPNQLDQENKKLKKLKDELTLYEQLNKKVEILFKIIQKQKMNESNSEISQKNEEEEDDDEEEGEDEKNYYRLDEFSILLEVQKEFYSACPPLDRIFYYVCTSVISDKMKELLTNKNIKETLNKKSSHSLKRLDIEFIRKNKDCMSEEEINDIQLSHIQYLNDKFNEIIQKFYPPNYRALAYEKNKEFLIKVIDEDREKFIFDSTNETSDKSNETNKNEHKAGKRRVKDVTNYHIRETEAENETELKLILENGQNIDSVIDDDFK